MIKLIDCKKIMIGEHSFQRMFERDIKPEDVIDTVRTGEVIQEYPKNDSNSFCFVVTVYQPSNLLWSPDFKNKIV